MKFANTLTAIECLSYYDRPLLMQFVDPSTGVFWLAAWIDESPETVQWHMIQVSAKDMVRLLSKDYKTALTLRQAIERSPAVYRCSANTFDYGSITEGELITPASISEEAMPSDGSYVRMEAWEAWQAAGEAPLKIAEPFELGDTGVADTVPGAHLDWPDITTVPDELTAPVDCMWTQTNGL